MNTKKDANVRRIMKDMLRVNVDDKTPKTGTNKCDLGVSGREDLHKPIHVHYRSNDGSDMFRFTLDGEWLQERKTEKPPKPELLQICKDWLDKKPTDITYKRLGVKTNRHMIIVLWFRENPDWVGDANSPVTRKQLLEEWNIGPLKSDVELGFINLQLMNFQEYFSAAHAWDTAAINVNDNTQETGRKKCTLVVYWYEGICKPIHVVYISKDKLDIFGFTLDGEWFQERDTEPPKPELLRICKEWLDKVPTDHLTEGFGIKTNRHWAIEWWFRENCDLFGSSAAILAAKLQVLKEWGIEPVARLDYK